MTYGQLLEKLRKIGIDQIGRMTSEGYDWVRVAIPKEAVFPYVLRSYRIILDKDLDTEIDDEIIDALLRRFDKTRPEFDSA